MKLQIASFVMMVIIVGGCGGGRAYLRENTPVEPDYHVGVLEFNNLSETLSIDLEKRLREATRFDLFTRGRYTLAGQGEMDAAREKLGIKGSSLSREEINGLSEVLGLDLLVWGEVLEYEKADVLKAFNSVRIMVSIVDARSGDQVGVVEYGEFSIFETSGSLARRVIWRAVEMLDEEFRKTESRRSALKDTVSDLKDSAAVLKSQR